jgi:hypothetical protein
MGKCGFVAAHPLGKLRERQQALLAVTVANPGVKQAGYCRPRLHTRKPQLEDRLDDWARIDFPRRSGKGKGLLERLRFARSAARSWHDLLTQIAVLELCYPNKYEALTTAYAVITLY